METKSERRNRVASSAGGDHARAREEQEALPQQQDQIPREGEAHIYVPDGMQITSPALVSESVLLDKEKGDK